MERTKRTVSYVVGLCLVSAAVSVAGAGPAGADETDFLYDLNNAGIGGPPDQLLAAGRSVCGQPRDASISAITSSTALGEGDSAFLYDSAARFLCV